MNKTNFVLIEFNNPNLSVYVDKYSDENDLKELREKYRNTHAFFRHYGTEIIVLPMIKDAQQIGKERTIDVNKDYKLVSRFIQEVVFQQIKSVGNTPNRYRPISLISRATKDDLIFSIVEPAYKDKIGYKKGYEIESRVFCPEGNPIFGLVINSYYRWCVNITCEELVNKKIDIVGKYVCEDIIPNNKELAPRRQLVGVVKDVKGYMAIIQSRDGLITKDLSVIFPENSYENREYLIKKLLGESCYSKVIRKIVSTSGQRKNARAQFESIDFLLNNWFAKQIFTNNNGFSFKVNGYYGSNSKYWAQASLQKPSYIFDLYESKTDINQDRGLRNYGPYDSGFFDRKVPNIAVICRAINRGTVTSFLSKLENGIPSITVPWGQPYGQGLVGKYKLNNIQWRVFEVQTEKISDYERTIRECLDSHIDWDLALVEVTESYKQLPNADNPYYFSKAKLMSNNIPVQGIKIENMIKDDKVLVYILNNISLACYAKMGGIPWVIPSSKKIDIELVIGIGSTIIKKNRFDFERRIVGLTTIFSSDGKYLLSNKSKDVAFHEYFDELLKSLKSVIEEIKKREGWQKGNTLRLVFNCFKPFKRTEIRAIKELVNMLNEDLDVRFAFLHIAYNQPFFMLDNMQKGVPDYRNKGKTKGEWLPNRGANVKLDANNYLLQLTGPKDLKTYKQGMARPLLIKLDEASTFKDIDYLVQQLYSFAHLSWRSFFPCSTPVTILYSQLIAQLLGNMRDISFWDSDNILNKLRFSRWFL